MADDWNYTLPEKLIPWSPRAKDTVTPIITGKSGDDAVDMLALEELRRRERRQHAGRGR